MAKISYYTKLSAVSFHQDNLKQVRAGKTMLRAVAEPDNPYDKFAVRVEALLESGWGLIGYIQKGKNEAIQKELLAGKPVEIICTEVTGLDKDTLGCNVGITYGEETKVDLASLQKEEVFIGDSKYIYFDKENHQAYDEFGVQLVSGSRFEKEYTPTVDFSYPAKALAKSTGAKKEDIELCWNNSGELAADLGTLIHKALQYYIETQDATKLVDKHKEREHSAENWMPSMLGSIVDSFMKASQLKSAATEVRVKHGTRTGIIDCLILDDKDFIIYDYKVTKEIKEVKYQQFGKLPKYTLQQNFYRQILEDEGYTCKGMYLWQFNEGEWKKIAVPKVNVKGE